MFITGFQLVPIALLLEHHGNSVQIVRYIRKRFLSSSDNIKVLILQLCKNSIFSIYICECGLDGIQFFFSFSLMLAAECFMDRTAQA